MVINYTLVKGDNKSKKDLHNMLSDIQRLAKQHGYCHVTIGVGENAKYEPKIPPKAKPKVRGGKALGIILS